LRLNADMVEWSPVQTQSKKLFFYLFFIPMIVVSPTIASELAGPTLRLSGDFPRIGTFSVTVFQSLENPWSGPVVFQTNIPAERADADIVLPELSGSNHVVRVLHDANSDGQMNSNAFGVPTESSVRQPLDRTARRMDLVIGPPPADPRAWGAGVMTIYSSNPYRGGDTVWRVLPALTFVGERLYVVGPRAGYNLFKNRWVSVGAVAEYKFAGDAFDDSPFLEGMKDRRDTAMGGFDLNVRGFGPWRVDSSVMTDLLGRHDGQELNLALSRTFRGKTWAITPGVGTVWRSADYNDYYFGVRDNEATGERPAYAPGASVEWFARIFNRFELTDSWSVLLNLRFELLSDDVQESPIVDKEILTTMFIGLNYAF
jgi:outer membrane protein